MVKGTACVTDSLVLEVDCCLPSLTLLVTVKIELLQLPACFSLQVLRDSYQYDEPQTKKA